MTTFTKVDRDLCIACGACNIAAPDIFDYTLDGLAYSTLDANSGQTTITHDDLLLQVQEAHIVCPTDAIMVQDKAFEDDSTIDPTT